MDIQPIPRLGWDPVPDCRGVVGRILVREGDAANPDFFIVQLRFAEHATIHEHPGENDAIVVCIDGEGFTSIAGETAPLREEQWVRLPKGLPHRLWTEDSTMTTLVIERRS